jgi:Flp pilus assembly pilin Flp
VGLFLSEGLRARKSIDLGYLPNHSGMAFTVSTGAIHSGEATMQDVFSMLDAAVKAILTGKEGQSLTEYALCFTMVALATVAGMESIAHGVNTTFFAVTTTLNTAIK